MAQYPAKDVSGVHSLPINGDTWTAHQRINSTSEEPTILDAAIAGGGAGTVTENWPEPEAGSVEDERLLGLAFIPLKFFHEVTGRAVDPDGNPITEARFIATADNLGTVGSVDDEGYFSIYLLRVPYQTFFIGVQETEEVDLVWYRQAEGQRISGRTDDQDLVFEPQALSTPLDTTIDLRFA